MARFYFEGVPLFGLTLGLSIAQYRQYDNFLNECPDYHNEKIYFYAYQDMLIPVNDESEMAYLEQACSNR